MAPVNDLGMYGFINLSTGKIKPEKLFMNDDAEDFFELEKFRTATKRLHVILDARYERAKVNKVMEKIPISDRNTT